MRSFALIVVLLAASQVSGIQVECRQCYLLRQNEEYFEQAKKEKRKECCAPSVVAPVSMRDVALEDMLDDIPIPEAPLVENAASTGELL